ncbi:hypothetical protein T484DRAFT_1887813 [Baffinella frigidus]|nr:hypothetical protein T484DRAFT_1887813 [Cryptophyta sp. CCMP2293]
MASNPDVIISGMLGPPDAFALLCRGGAPPARQKRGRTLGVGMAQGGEQRPRAERAAAAGEPSASEYRPARGDWARAPSHARSHARSQTKSGSSSPGTPQPPGTPAAEAPRTRTR